MNNYQFRFPADTPELDFASLAAYLDGWDERAIGTTVTVESYREGVIDILLYGLRIAQIGPNIVFFPGPDDPHMATSAWLGRIVRDNAMGSNVWRVRRLKGDGPGPEVARGRAGLLCIDGDRDKPVFGRAYPVGDIEGMRRRDAESRVQLAADRVRWAEESARREALKTWTGDGGTFYATDDYSHEHGTYWRVVDGTFRDGGAAYDTVGYVHDTRPGSGASPEPDPENKPVFMAFTGGEDHRRDSFGPFCDIWAALAVIGYHARQAANA